MSFQNKTPRGEPSAVRDVVAPFGSVGSRRRR
jgi:hypothetical protein